MTVMLYRCLLPAAHRQPKRPGQSQQGGSRVHRVQAILGQPRSGGHVGSRGSHQQPQRHGKDCLPGKGAIENCLTCMWSGCKLYVYAVEMIAIDIIHAPSLLGNSFRQTCC